MNRSIPRIWRSSIALLTGIMLLGVAKTGTSESPDVLQSDGTDNAKTPSVRLSANTNADAVAYNFQFQIKKERPAADGAKDGGEPATDEPAPPKSSAPDRTQFGMEWPALKECLQFSDEGGEWIGGGVTYRFEPDGGFRASYTTAFFNRLYRQRQRSIQFTGRWKLALREITTADQKELNIQTKDKTKGHFLVVTLTEVTVDPPFGEKEEISKIFPSPKGGRFSKEAKLFLDEVNEYLIPGTRYIGKTDPRFLHWIVLDDELGFFPEETAIGEKAWTLVHKINPKEPADNEKKK
ncbi:MAG: hypothetical protein WEB58_13890 [Planctomycetaceae bacterium]